MASPHDTPQTPPAPEVLAAELASVLRTGVTVDSCRSAAALMTLAVVAAKSASNESNDLAVGAANLVREACARVDDVNSGPTAVLLGVAPGYRGRPLKDRRREAAEALFIQPETLRKDREPLLIEAVADEIYAMDSAYRLRHRHRNEAERQPLESRLRVDWLAQHRSYRRIWSPVTALRNDLLVLIEYLSETRDAGQVPRAADAVDEGEQPVSDATWLNLTDRCANLTFRLAQFTGELDRFVTREGGLWLLADAEAETRAADTMFRLVYHFPFGEANNSWARSLLARTPSGELAELIALLGADPDWDMMRRVWLEWGWEYVEHEDPLSRSALEGALMAEVADDVPPPAFQAVAPEEPSTECGRWLAASEEFIALIDDDWYRVADWYRKTRGPMPEGT
ncbi:MAG: hypothetical protein JHC84_05365 [Solirubrobacteraceae bacterium]|nr:hypothetical protein [Solirubrobacteraceae bacterium]